MFRIELHTHTSASSACSRLDAGQIVEGYLAAGYSGIVITDHYHRSSRWFCCTEQKDLKTFLAGYEQVVQKALQQGLKVYRGAEVRFDGDPNDYLVYGYSDSLLSAPEDVFSMGLAAFSAAARRDGALLIQAHPFRRGPYEVCAPADPKWLDGIEIFNGNPAVDNRNAEAAVFAQQHPQLLQLSGSDSHNPREIGTGGIAADMLPADDRQLAALLRSGCYQLLCSR